MAGFKVVPPVWYWIVSAVLALWGLVGCYACYMQFHLGPDAMGPATDYDRALFATLPRWYNYVYALAVGTGLLGGLALLFRSRSSRTLYIVSLAGMLWQFGYLFVTSDIIAHKGAGAVLPFPIFLIVVGIASIWFTGLAQRRGYTS